MKARSLVELFKLMKANEDFFETGLCLLVIDMYRNKIITYLECSRLSNYIRNNRPKKGSKHYNPNKANSLWYWPLCLWRPRLLWINAQIKLLSKK